MFTAFLRSQQIAVATAVAPEATVIQKTPTYVNAKQFHRFLKRRETRAILQEHYGKQVSDKNKKKTYKHESRHRHAKKRPRGPRGCFLPKEEFLEYYWDHPEEDPSKPESLEWQQNAEQAGGEEKKKSKMTA